MDFNRNVENGRRKACGWRKLNLRKSGSADQALETVITAVEKDPRFHSVGYSGLPNQVGVVQLDGGYMNGDTLSIGAVG